MKHFWKAASLAFAVSALGLAMPASAQPYADQDVYNQNYGNQGYDSQGPDNGYADQAYDDQDYGPPDGVPYDYNSGGYCDQYGCPDDYYDLPIYYGPVFYNNFWFDGPVYTRDWQGQRQYWIHGGWHNDQWRGARPSWYRAGRVGPALGRNYYARNFQDRRDFVGRNDVRGTQRGFDNRNARSANSFTPQVQARQADPGRSFANRDSGGRDFGNRDGGRNFGGRNFADRGQPQGNRGFDRGGAQPQAQAPANNSGHGDHGGGHDHGDHHGH